MPAPAFVMTEHPAWVGAATDRRRVLVTVDGGRWLAQVRDGGLVVDPLDAAGAAAPAWDVVAVTGDVPAVPELGDALRGLGGVTRVRTADLWEAVATGIVRQVIRAGQARIMYRAFCDAHGEKVALPGGGDVSLFPTPQTVLGLPDEAFAQSGMAFKRPALRSAAAAYLEHGEKWLGLEPAVLAAELQSVPRIGPWTAHVAVADWAGAWDLHPVDLAVRTWARHAVPGHDWPQDEAGFTKAWVALAGDRLGELTLLTLAWGARHAGAL